MHRLDGGCVSGSDVRWAGMKKPGAGAGSWEKDRVLAVRPSVLVVLDGAAVGLGRGVLDLVAAHDGLEGGDEVGRSGGLALEPGL